MKLGYQDVGSATLLKVHPARPPQGGLALSAVHQLQDGDLEKSHVGLTFTRESDIWDKSFTERAPKLGGLIEFYRSRRVCSGPRPATTCRINPKLAQLWCKHRRCVVRCEDAAGRDGLARLRPGFGDGTSGEIRRPGACGRSSTRRNAEYWFAKSAKDGNIAPQRKLANEKPKGETIDYDTLIKSWPASPRSAPRRTEAAVIVPA